MKLKQTIVKILMILFRIFPVDEKKIVFDNFNGKGYGDSGKYIVEEILRQKKDFKIIWLVNQTVDCRQFPESVQTVKIYSLRSFYELATAKFWIDNVRKPYFVLKRKQQFYIQTWHGGIALKRIEKDAEQTLPESYLKDAKSDSSKIDVIISNCKMFTNLAENSFWYAGEILEVGLPRNDIFFRKQDFPENAIKQKLGLQSHVRIVLYAPTFRKEKKAGNRLDTEEILKSLKKKLGGEWVLLVRFHPNDSESLSEFRDTINEKNVTLYPDIQELLLISDVLITDYSATMFEFSMLRKPVFLYVYDLEEYVKDRNFYFQIAELPFEYAKTSDELIHNIEKFNVEIYEKNVEGFQDKIGLCESGCASIEILKRMEQEQKKKI